MTSVLKVDNIQNSSGTQSMNIHSSGFVIPPAGGIIQIQYDQYTGASTQAVAQQADTVLNNLSVSITPTSTSSIIKLEAQMLWEHNNTGSEYDHIFFFYRGTTKLGHAADGNRNVGVMQGATAFYSNDASSTPSVLHMTFFDTPSTTNAITYKIGANFYNGNTFYLNRTVLDNNANNYERGVSIISATEIAG